MRILYILHIESVFKEHKLDVLQGFLIVSPNAKTKDIF